MKYKFFSAACTMALMCSGQIWGMMHTSNSCPAISDKQKANVGNIQQIKLMPGSSQYKPFIIFNPPVNSAEEHPRPNIQRPGSPSFHLDPKPIPEAQAKKNLKLFETINQVPYDLSKEQRTASIKTLLMSNGIVETEEKALKIAQIASRITMRPIPEEQEFKGDKIYTIWLGRHPADETNETTDVHDGDEETNLSRSPIQIVDIKQFWSFQDMYGGYFLWFSSPTLRALALVENFAKIIKGLKEQNLGIKPEQLSDKLLYKMLIDPIYWLNESDGECGLEVIARLVEVLDLIINSLKESNKFYAYAMSHRLPIYHAILYYLYGQIIPGTTFPNLALIELLVDQTNREYKIRLEPGTKIPRVLMPFEYGKYFQKSHPNLLPIIKDDDVNKIRLQEMSAKCQLDAFSKKGV